MKDKAIGKKLWVVPGGHVPLNSTGHEPTFTSHDKLSILNTGSGTAEVKLTIFFPDRAPYGPYELKVEGKRVKKVRFNDLIDPLAIPLGYPYSCLLEADGPVVVQFTRQDTTQEQNAGCTTIAFPAAE